MWARFLQVGCGTGFCGVRLQLQMGGITSPQSDFSQPPEEGGADRGAEVLRQKGLDISAIKLVQPQGRNPSLISHYSIHSADVE